MNLLKRLLSRWDMQIKIHLVDLSKVIVKRVPTKLENYF